tara:strand:- start:4682 stop:5152 length:471 start_codon:yes stop_codon:yes gene_type:complete
MLEMLIAANSAFAIIKKTLENGREISSAGSAIASFVGAEDKLRADVQRKKNSLWTKFLGKEDNELEEFMALEEIRRKQNMLREYMQLYGRANLYTDYIEFCAEARRNRKEANKKQAQRKAYIQDVITKIILGLLITILISGFLGAAFLIMRKKGLI